MNRHVFFGLNVRREVYPPKQSVGGSPSAPTTKKPMNRHVFFGLNVRREVYPPKQSVGGSPSAPTTFKKRHAEVDMFLE